MVRVRAASRLIDDNGLGAVRHRDDGVVNGDAVTADAEDLHLPGAGLGDPELLSRCDEAHVVGLRRERDIAHDLLFPRIDDEELSRRAVGDVERAERLLHRRGTVVVAAGVVPRRAESRD